MTPDRPDDANHLIDRLVAAESNDALAEFRTKDFAAAVRMKIATSSPPRKRRFAFLGAVPLPARIAGAAAVLVGVALLLSPPGKKQGSQMTSAIEDLLRQAPVSQEVESPAAKRSRVEKDRVSPAETAIVAALLAWKQSAAAAQESVPETKPSGEAKRLRPLGLEEMYKILFIDKSVERVLKLVSS